jgi:hypothetical protein
MFGSSNRLCKTYISVSRFLRCPYRWKRSLAADNEKASCGPYGKHSIHLSHKDFSMLCARGSVAVLLSLSWTAAQQCVFCGPVQRLALGSTNNKLSPCLTKYHANNAYGVCIYDCHFVCVGWFWYFSILTFDVFVLCVLPPWGWLFDDRNI